MVLPGQLQANKSNLLRNHLQQKTHEIKTKLKEKSSEIVMLKAELEAANSALGSEKDDYYEWINEEIYTPALEKYSTALDEYRNMRKDADIAHESLVRAIRNLDAKRMFQDEIFIEDV